MPRASRRLSAVVAATVLLGSPALLLASPARASATSVALVGDLQSELGCPGDWDPACPDTELTHEAGTDRWSTTAEVPAGTWSFKVALDDAWTENYGAAGALDGPNIPLVLAGPARMEFAYDDATHAVTATPLDLAGGTTRADRSLAKDSLRSSLTRERFYFVMADRFANGSTANDRGGLTGGRLTTGFDPTDKGFYHGGDLAGLTRKLDYIKGMGTTAIWLTPSFENKPVQGPPGQESAGYHGYWITDFTRIDPHLGTNADMKALIAAAHRKGMKVFFDIITNHTADVIDYREGAYDYQSKAAAPYRTADGTVFDDRDYVNQPFPDLDPAVSFPYTPFLHPGDEDAKTPAWLNDVTRYHNRGNSTFAGESATYGDFSGLDDLFTEQPEVVKGMGDIYKTWVDFGIDGFRIDTVKHVNLEFWQKFIPDILGEAARVRNDDFFAFGEVYDGNPAVMSQYTTAGKLQATLDFGFQQQGVDFAKGKPASALADFFAKDDWYTDADSNVYQLPTFLGNHDMGRVAMFLKDSSATEAEHLERVELADALMYTVRGNPVTYYGDEQGFIGTGGDQLAREDMFASRVDVYNSEDVLAGPEGSRDRYSTRHPLYRELAALARLRAKNPALADGAQVQRYADDGDGLFAFSRIGAAGRDDHDGHDGRDDDRRSSGREHDDHHTSGQREYLVVANNSTTAQDRDLRHLDQPEPVHAPLRHPRLPAHRDRRHRDGHRAPAHRRGVEGGHDHRHEGGRTDGDPRRRRRHRRARTHRGLGHGHERDLRPGDVLVPARRHDAVAAARDRRQRPLPGLPGRLGDAAGHTPGVPGRRRGRRGPGGRRRWLGRVTAEPPSSTVPELGDPPATQPGSVAVAGTHNTAMGCSADWMPACPQAQLALDPDDGIWKKTFTLPAGSYGYKAALDGSWTENYGAGGVRDGANIDYTTDGTNTFFYDPTTHWVTSDDEPGPIVVAAGSFQSELGCPVDFAPDCMRPWLQDKDGDGVYALQTALIPAGTWTFKIAHDLSWDVNYGDGGVPDGADMSFTVPADGATTTFLYDSVSHETTVTSVAGG